MQLFLAALPLVLLSAFVLGRWLVRRPLGRPTLRALAALLLLGYAVATAALGLFWVARMELPRFELHYVVGYCMLAALALHVALELGPLAAWLRRTLPSGFVTHDRTRLSLPTRLAGGMLLATLLSVPAVAWILGCIASSRVGIVRERAAPGGSSSVAVGAPEVVIMHQGRRTSAADWLYEASRMTRRGIVSDPIFVARRPADAKSLPGEASSLPAPRARAGSSLDAALSALEAQKPVDGAIVVERPARAPGEAELSTLLHAAAGVTRRDPSPGGLSLRAAASAGALYPVDLYVATDELAPSYYHPLRHELSRLGVSAGAWRDALPPQSPLGDAPLLFALAASFDRTAFKYGRRSYRYAALDAGHVAGNLVLTAAALGLHCALEPWFDDERLARALGAGAGEGALLVVGCSSRPLSSPSRALAPEHEPVTLPASTEGKEPTRLAHLLTSIRLVTGEHAKDAGARGRGREPEVPSAAARTALPPASGSSEDVLELVARRRSVRSYGEAPLSASTLGSVMADAWRGARVLLDADLVELFVLVSRVEGVAEGAYRYDPTRHALEPLRRGPMHEAVERAGLGQSALGEASAVLLWAYSRAHYGARDGARDFRVGALQAGLGGALAYLSATSRALGVCGMGAFYDDEIAELVGTGTRPLYLMALGPR